MEAKKKKEESSSEEESSEEESSDEEDAKKTKEAEKKVDAKPVKEQLHVIVGDVLIYIHRNSAVNM